MQNPFTAKEQSAADTPLLLFTCTTADGAVWRWSSRTITWNGAQYEGRVLRQSLFEAQAASDTQVGGAPKLTFELANADSELSEIEAQSGFKGAQLTVQLMFVDVTTGTVTQRSGGGLPWVDEPTGADHRDNFSSERDEPDVAATGGVAECSGAEDLPVEISGDRGATSGSCGWRTCARPVLSVLSRAAIPPTRITAWAI